MTVILEATNWDDRPTPEHSLWWAVLSLYVNDMENLNISQEKADYILREAEHFWTVRICNLVGLDHGYFVKKLKHINEMNRGVRAEKQIQLEKKRVLREKTRRRFQTALKYRTG